LATLHVPDGFDISLFASEPMITNPAAIDVDTHGRVWVAEIQWYRRAAVDPPADKIKVLEDTDGDGRADRATVFADGVFAPMSICVAGDKVYVATSPDLWVYEDKDGDLRADGPPKKLLTGFGGHNHDHGAHSLVLGPDHKWWMSHGDTGFDVRGTDDSHIKFRWGAMLRGELDGSQLETVAVNFRNPYEICVNSFGESFCSDNDNDGNFSVRICWIMEGGDYGWFGGPPFGRDELDTRVLPGTPFRDGWHFRAYEPGYVPATLVTGFGSPCGICYYEGDAFGERYKNAPLHTDAGPREVRIYRHQPTGYGMTASSEVFVSTDGDDYFRPDDICAAPDGSLYVSDWYDGGVGGHAYNDPDRGRIFLLRPVDRRKLMRVGKPGPYESVDDAIEALKNPNLATQYLAREKLISAGQLSAPALEGMLSADDPNHRARALWVLDRIGGDARRQVVEQLDHDDPALRALTVRILRRHGQQYAERIVSKADDVSPVVRREVLLALRDLRGKEAEAALVKSAAAFDGKDRYQLEAIHIAAGDRGPQLLARLEGAGEATLEKIQLLEVLDAEAASRLLVDSLAKTSLSEEERAVVLRQLGGSPSPEAADAVLKLAFDEQSPVGQRRLALNLLEANLSGHWQALTEDKRLLNGLRELMKDDSWQEPVLNVIEVHSLDALAGEVVLLAENQAAPDGARRRAIEVAVGLNAPEVAAALSRLLSDSSAEVAAAAVSGLATLQDLPSLRKVLTGDDYSDALRKTAADRLIASTGGALLLLRLIEEEQLKGALREEVIARATTHPDSNVRVLYEKFIPEGQRPQRLGDAFGAEEILALEGDARRGQRIFAHSSAAQCKNCHAVEGEGGAVGPDLSQIGKKYERKTLLETILDPSKAIAPEYVPYVVETTGGRVFAGFVVENNDRQLVLKDAEGKLIRIPADEVDVLERREKSLMPELVLRDVTAQDAADLLAYMTGLTASVQSVGRFQVLGPFSAYGSNDQIRQEVEASLGDVDRTGEYEGLDGATIRWEPIAADNSQGFLAVDTVKYCDARGLRSNAVVHYFLVYADSAAQQPAELLVGSDDGCKVWVNGRAVHEHNVHRAIGYGQDRVKTKLQQGRNTIVVRVANGDGPGGVSLAVASDSLVQLATQ